MALYEPLAVGECFIVVLIVDKGSLSRIGQYSGVLTGNIFRGLYVSFRYRKNRSRPDKYRHFIEWCICKNIFPAGIFFIRLIVIPLTFRKIDFPCKLSRCCYRCNKDKLPKQIFIADVATILSCGYSYTKGLTIGSPVLSHSHCQIINIQE